MSKLVSEPAGAAECGECAEDDSNPVHLSSWWSLSAYVENRSLDGVLLQLLQHNASFTAETLFYNVAYLLAAAFVTVFCWKFYYTPTIWKRDLTEIGYNHMLDNANVAKNDKRRVDTINRLRRLRRVGERIPPPYPNGWFAILQSEELAVGQAKNVDCLGQNFVVFRAQGTAKVHVLNAYCPHLGANLGVGGVVRGNCIECPFHHWSFSGDDGQCVNIPYCKSGSVPKVAKVKKWTSLEANGYIFVWYHVDEEAKPWELDIVPEVEDGRWSYYGKNEFLVNVHIQDIPENGADVAHLSAVHGPNYLSGSDLRTFRSFWTTFAMHAWDASWHAPGENDPPHIARMDLKHSIRVLNKLEMCTVLVQARQIGPGYVRLQMQTGVGPMVVLQSVTPVEPLMQKVIHRFYAPRNLGNAFFQKFFNYAESIMFERDMMIWNHKQFNENPQLVKEDRLIRAYRKWYSQFYSSNSVSYAAAKDALDW